MNRPALIVVGLLVGVAALVYWQFSGTRVPASPDSAASPNTADVSVAPPSVSTGTRELVKTPQSSPVLDNGRSFAELRPELEQRARAGDGHAAWRLGTVLAKCNGYVPVSDEELESIVVDDYATGFMKADTTPDAYLRKTKLRHAQRRLDCGNVSGLSESDQDNAANKKAFHWMELGASLGDADAQAMYASLAFEVFDHRNVLAEAEQIRARKRLAQNFLERSLAQGDALALQQYSTAYADGLLFPKDAEAAYQYLYAFSLTSRANDFVPGVLQLALESGATGLDATALARAQESGRRLASCCMAGKRVKP